ncbi:MAG: alpha-(1-_3)-arabinofuranosyltransferase family protein, partial [Mobilicoccus sp.]|nr:alpha-(1->3)-arabinofuranosyltransferase family protein [Mobilicoccus sp.]
MSGASSPTSLPSGDSRESLHTRTPLAEPGTTSAVWRARLIAACLLLTTAAFHQGGGRVVPDTKLDLTVDPLAFLTRALSVWDPAGHLGQLQNQAYGYLFPMGPFHLLFHTAGVPDWVTQRLWWSLVLCVAFLGFWKLATAVGVGGPWSRYLGALLFALSPRFISEIAVTSIEVWPLAMAPWVLLPLLDPRPLRTRSRIVRSAVAFGCIGGVNAVATGAALVLPTLWWLTRAARLRAARDGVLWLLACLAAAAWWIGPLLLLGRYSPPFLDWIESAATTTGTASAFSALQGTTPWLVYLRVAEGPTWPGGWVLASQPILIVATTVPAVIGLAGLVSRRLPQHVFWRVSAVVGLALLTMGFLGPASGPLAPALRELLDGPLAAFRNIHKFELVVRIPLMIGFVAAVHRGAVALTGLADRHRVRVARPLLAVVTGVLVVAMAAPVVAATLPRAGGYDELPDYWRETATWLDAQPGPGSVLILPAAPFADFTWGSTRDEPLQALMRRPFAVRDAVPLGNAGSTRFLDEVERQLRTGHAGPALRDALARTGIRYLVVRGDLTATARTAPPLAVHQALERAEIPRVAAFGPPTGSAYEAPGFTVNERTLLPYPSIEIFDVGPVAEAGLVPVTALRVLTGGPDDLPAHPAISPSGVVVDAADAHALPKESAAVPDVLSDSGTRREVNYGRASNNRSDVLTVEDPGRLDRRVPDYLVDPDAPRTVLRWEGVRDVTASSSRSDANSLVHASSGESPGAALDGERSTRWVSGNYPDAVGEWWQVRLTEPTDLTGARLHIVSTEPGSALPVALDVTTDTGTTTMRFVPDEETLIGRGDGLLLDLPPGETTTLRITLRELGPGPVNGFAIAEVTIPGITAVSRLVMPPSASATPDAIAIRRQETGRDGCLRQGGRPLCALDLVSTPEEAHGLFRAFSTSEPEAAYTWSGTVRVRNTPEAERLLDAPGRATATATSTRVPSLSNRPGAVLDGDLGTGWVADAYDFLPTLTVTFPDEELRSIRGVRLTVDDNLAASRPTRVRIITSDDTARDLPVAPDGTVAFTARTSSVAITFLSWGQMQSIDAASRYVQDVPVGLSEVEILGAPDLTGPPPRQAPVAGRCGQGPTVRIGDQEVRTRVEATVGDLLADRALPWVPCSGTGDAVPSVTLGSGEHSLDAPGNHLFLPESMWLTRTDTATSSPARPWRDVATTADGGYDVPARADASVLVLPHNANAAWQAVDGGGTPLTAIRLDGRRQGYLLPAGPATT